MRKMNICPSALDLRADWMGLCQSCPDRDCKQITFAEIKPDNRNEVTQLKCVEPYNRFPDAPVYIGKLPNPMIPSPLHLPSLCLLFLNQRFTTMRVLFKRYPPLFREQIWKSGFWRYQNHLFLKVAAWDVSTAPGWISSVEGGVMYFSEQGFLLSSTRNNEILNMV